LKKILICSETSDFVPVRDKLLLQFIMTFETSTLHSDALKDTRHPG